MKGDDFLKELHTNDLSMNSGKLFREQMIDNFEAIEQAITDIYNRLEILEKKNKQDSDFDKHLYD
ncbi:hypothetical protein LMB81_08250 [Limosilactobacillus reuteri]|uniref:hypothetical protein n=1 Tax=Limosilactobacillus reuteri TaxID=1598 RepID=UPI001E5AE659|nr:hypothetical protein [Limosilactobacillus reuteri]MCC4491482.1 hypothetical protein [Limosilactobacillus reuteri]